MTDPVPDEAVRLVDELELSHSAFTEQSRCINARTRLMAYIAGVVKERDAQLDKVIAEKIKTVALRAELATERAERFLVLSELEQARKALRGFTNREDIERQLPP